MTISIPRTSIASLVRRRLADLGRMIRRGDGKSARQMLALMPHFFKNAPEPFVLAYRSEDLLALLSCAYRVMILTRGRKAVVSAFNPVEIRNGFSSDRTVIQISAPDGPFYVSSVRERLRSMGHTIVHLIHPILPVNWDTRGQLAGLGESRLSARQSLIHIEIDRVEDRRKVVKIEKAIRAVFSDIFSAVRDFEKMRAALSAERLALSRRPEGVQQLSDFLQWLDAGNFVFLGYREYDLTSKNGRRFFSVRRGSGLGILRRERRSRFFRPVLFSRLPLEVRRGLVRSAPYGLTKTTKISPIHRRERMVYLWIKKFDARGRAAGERRWIGLFTNRVEGQPPAEIPILREKFEQIVSEEGAEPHTHNYREIYGIFSSYPKDFLFGAGVADLRREIRAAMEAQSSRDFRASFRPSIEGIFVMVVMLKDKFSRDVRLRIEERLKQRLAASEINYSLSMGAEEGEFARLYFSCVTSRKQPIQGTFADLERELAGLSKTWPDRMREELVERLGAKSGQRLFGLYGGAFSVEFYSHTPPSGAVRDIARLESLYAGPAPIGVDLFNSGADSDCSRLKLYHLHSKLILSDIMPILTDHGFEVVDEVSNSVRVSGRPPAFIHTFRLKTNAGPIDVPRVGASLSESIQGSILRRTECDPLSALILQAHLVPREVALMRLYRNYLHQLVPVHTLRSIDTALVRNSAGARLLMDLFMARFDPALGAAAAPARRKKISAARVAIEDFLESVDDLVEDRIFRLLAGEIEATVRTNYFHRPARRTLGIKVQSEHLLSAPKPVPLFEIFVSDPDFEGVHLRGGPIARGGIRHSDRRDDYRTEILGLMKTQTVKNAIIVPVGAKGGFAVKTAAPRDRMQELAVACYRAFIRTLLDLTDNVIGQRIVHPVDCVIYDGPDPYLVVAADKGTAHFSDIANEIALDAGYWLGDAFASGGKNGYDHKKLGITARGVWECIRHHLEMLSEEKKAPPGRVWPITCAGIGDMSGDVFGNGMMLGSTVRVGSRRVLLGLRAAFNHQYIFLDPNPDPRKSFAERRRLFRMPHSSWDDYSRSAISPGGGVFLRALKKIVLAKPAAAMLGIPSGVASGEEVVRSILKMDVDLLYNGGIGTYVKAAWERNPDVGDSSNDRVRINAEELRCRIVAEGGNVGFTQAARVEFSKRGGRINSDAVDNSAGVDLSDHEVNLKILLSGHGVSGVRRQRILRRLSGVICKSVLMDNTLQSRILSLEEWRSRRQIREYPRLMDKLFPSGGLTRETEGLPSDRELAERAKSGVGLYRPELAVILACVKLAIDRSLLEMSASGRPLAADPVFGRFLYDYFPKDTAKMFGRDMAKHRLAEQIACASAANAFVNRTGLMTALRLASGGASLAESIRAYFVAEALVNAEAQRNDLARAGSGVPAVLDVLEEGLVRVAGWLLQEYRGGDVAAALRRFPEFPGMLQRAPTLLSETEKKNFDQNISTAMALGVPPALARRLAEVQMAVRLLDLKVASARLRGLR